MWDASGCFGRKPGVWDVEKQGGEGGGMAVNFSIQT